MTALTGAIAHGCSCCGASALTPCLSPTGRPLPWTHLERSRA